MSHQQCPREAVQRHAHTKQLTRQAAEQMPKLPVPAHHAVVNVKAAITETRSAVVLETAYRWQTNRRTAARVKQQHTVALMVASAREHVTNPPAREVRYAAIVHAAHQTGRTIRAMITIIA